MVLLLCRVPLLFGRTETACYGQEKRFAVAQKDVLSVVAGGSGSENALLLGHGDARADSETSCVTNAEEFEGRRDPGRALEGKQ